MKNVNFELLLNRNINELSFLGSFENKLDPNIYMISNPKLEFLGYSTDQILVNTNDNKIVTSIYIILPKPINKELSKKIINNYGENYEVMVIDKLYSKESTELVEGLFRESNTKESFSLKKGSIMDKNINNIIWDKRRFRLVLFYNYIKNRNELHLISKTD